VAFLFPQKWSTDELQEARKEAEAAFVVERVAEGAHAYYAQLKLVEARVRQTLADTDNLRRLSGVTLQGDPGLWQTLRYFCAPPVSEEDLWTLVGRKFKRTTNESIANSTAVAISKILDKIRFPWILGSDNPDPADLEGAVRATTVLLAHELFKTERRKNASKKQENRIADELIAMGLTLDPARTPILTLDTLARGSFSRERKVDGAKCDVPVRLRDGRLLALECKVSNGPKNSWKRLHREVGGKAERWRQEFGTQIVTGAVLAGVYDLSCLQKSQAEHGVYLFWQHNLDPLKDFVQAVN
jgi:hypothetical protein